MVSDETKYQLEEMVDSEGLSGILFALAEITREKAQHIRESYSDYSLARMWEKDGNKIDKLAATF